MGGPRPNLKVIQTDRKALFNARLYKGSLVFGIIALLLLVSFTQARLNVTRDRLGLTRLPPLENAPPVLALTTVALGGFRGLIANMLWIRASDLQEQDKFFEMVQLADWITKLQPHFVSVWINQAWNMSYNISVKFTDPRDRWPWVRRGIELLRDEALKYNPNEPLIYRELAWHFQHKMGADLDDAHLLYKAAWIQEMNALFGRGRPDFDQLINPQTPEAVQRAATLRERFKMDPAWMKEADERYGPLEWHLPESHAIYWAYIALNKTDQRKLKKEDLLTCRRVIFQSLQLAFRRGRLVYPTADTEFPLYAPNVDIVAQADKAYLEMMDAEPQARKNIATGHRNFLRWAVYYLYVYGQRGQAEIWWNKLREIYPDSVLPGQTLVDYALDRAQETVGETSHDDAKAVIVGLLREAFWNAAIGEDIQAENYLNFARRFRERFQEAVGEKSVDRVGLPELDEVKEAVLKEMLDPERGLEPVLAAQLRTNLGLPAGWLPGSTNAPPANPSSTPSAETNQP
jgi:hypothetical protein